MKFSSRYWSRPGRDHRLLKSRELTTVYNILHNIYKFMADYYYDNNIHVCCVLV